MSKEKEKLMSELYEDMFDHSIGEIFQVCIDRRYMEQLWRMDVCGNITNADFGLESFVGKLVRDSAKNSLIFQEYNTKKMVIIPLKYITAIFPLNKDFKFDRGNKVTKVIE